MEGFFYMLSVVGGAACLIGGGIAAQSTQPLLTIPFAFGLFVCIVIGMAVDE